MRPKGRAYVSRRRTRERAPGETRDGIVDGPLRHQDSRASGRTADVRKNDDVRGEEWIIGEKRLGCDDSEAGTGDRAVFHANSRAD
jgi:hypothetical protein